MELEQAAAKPAEQQETAGAQAAKESQLATPTELPAEEAAAPAAASSSQEARAQADVQADLKGVVEVSLIEGVVNGFCAGG